MKDGSGFLPSGIDVPLDSLLLQAAEEGLSNRIVVGSRHSHEHLGSRLSRQT